MKCIKKLLIALTLLMSAVILPITAYGSDEIKIYVDGNIVQSEVKPVIINGSTFIPIKPVAEAMGCSVNWVSDTKTVRIASPDTIIAMQIGNNLMTVVTSKTGKNSDAVTKTVELAQAPRIINGSSYIPMRPMVEALGGLVEWNGNTKTIKITSSTASGVTYSFDEATGTLTINGKGEMRDYDQNDRPWEKYGESRIKRVVVGSGITKIGCYAFNALESLESAEIADTVTVIDSNAFCRCYSLSSVKMPQNLEKIGYGAFDRCTSLRSIDLPRSLDRIRDFAFSGCTALDNVVIPEGFSELGLGKGIFSGCKALKNVTLPESLTYIPVNFFMNCTALESIKIPTTVASIGSGAFSGCSSLTNITIPYGVKTIHEETFKNCTHLSTIFVGYGVDSIDKSAFDGCTNLTTVCCKQGSVADDPNIYPTKAEFVYF